MSYSETSLRHEAHNIARELTAGSRDNTITVAHKLAGEWHVVVQREAGDLAYDMHQAALLKSGALATSKEAVAVMYYVETGRPLCSHREDGRMLPILSPEASRVLDHVRVWG